MGARKISSYPVRELSLDAIKVDHSIQSRVSTSIEYQREFSEAMLRGDVFPPVTVFIDEKGVIRLADGFHRYGAAKKAMLRSIRAEVRPGSKRDAMVFSAGANIKFSIPRTKEDIVKALRMLFEDKEWFSKSDPLIAKHCGVHSSTVARHRKAFCEDHKVAPPNVIVYEQQGHTIVTDRSAVTSFTQAGVRSRLADRVPHSDLGVKESIAAARELGDRSPGFGPRRLLWRMADLLEAAYRE